MLCSPWDERTCTKLPEVDVARMLPGNGRRCIQAPRDAGPRLYSPWDEKACIKLPEVGVARMLLGHEWWRIQAPTVETRMKLPWDPGSCTLSRAGTCIYSAREFSPPWGLWSLGAFLQLVGLEELR